jgi:peptidoglycan hydrolase-like protein with peptidoglycan-binding domain
MLKSHKKLKKHKERGFYREGVTMDPKEQIEKYNNIGEARPDKPFDSQTYFDAHNNTGETPYFRIKAARAAFVDSLSPAQQELLEQDTKLKGELPEKLVPTLGEEQATLYNEWHKLASDRAGYAYKPIPVPGQPVTLAYLQQQFETSLDEKQKSMLMYWRHSRDPETKQALDNQLKASLTPEQRQLRKQIFKEYAKATPEEKIQFAGASADPAEGPVVKQAAASVAPKPLSDLAISGKGNDVKAYDPRVLEMQTRLAQLGIDVGPLDGKEGKQTREAVKEFAEKYGLDNPEKLTLAGVTEGAKTLIAQNESEAKLAAQQPTDYVSKIPDQIMFAEKPGSMVMALGKDGQDVIRDKYGKTPTETFANVSRLANPPEVVLDAGLTAPTITL